MDDVTVSANSVEVAEPQINETADTTASETGEVADSTVETKQVQTKEENHAFAEMRRAREAAEAEAQQIKRDYEVAKKYGADYGVFGLNDIVDKFGHQGITTIEAFEQAVQRQQYIDHGIDPAVIDQAIASNPDVQYAKEMRAKEEQQRYINSQVKALKEYAPDIDVSNLDPSIVNDWANGKSLVDAYIKFENQKLKSELEAFRQGKTTAEANEKNAQSTPGSTTGNGTSSDGFVTKEQVEANKHIPGWISKNLSLIEESMKKW